MSDPSRVPLGASTIVRKYYLDVNTGTDASPVWTPVYGMVNFQPSQDTTLQDDSDYDSSGYKSQTATAIAWGAQVTVSRKVVAAAVTTYDPGQEALRACSYGMGPANSIGVRYYEMTVGGPRIESFQGKAAVSWSPVGGAMDALDQVQVTLTGQGQRTTPSHPYPSAGSVPVISLLSPATAAAAGGAEIEIIGSHFLGTTAVTVNSVALSGTHYTVISDSLIVFTAPAESAGTYNVTVTNATGTSSAATITYS